MSRSLLGLLARRHGPRVTIEERRAFLASSLAIGATYLVSCHGLSPRRPSKDGKRVIVIGGGFSGLACAYELGMSGIDVQVVEARDRVGGRVLTFRESAGNAFIPGRTIEGGAELIGSNHPIWVTYAERFGLSWLDVTEDEGDAVSPIVLDGELLSFEESAMLWEQLETALSRLNELATPVPAFEPWNAPDALRLDALSLGAWITSLDLPDRERRILGLALTSDNGVDVARQSLLGQLSSVKGGGLESYWSESEVYRCRGGNDLLADALWQAIGEERVHLKQVVSRIARTAAGVVVETRDGERFEGDEVVLAVPPSVWSKIQFEPGLPAAMQPQMGLNTKNFAWVRSRFWETLDPRRSQYALSDGILHQTWDGTDAQGAIQDEESGACLVGFTGGSSVTDVLALSKEEREQRHAELYERCFPGFAEQLVEQRYMAWPKDPYTGAGYSFPAPGQVTTVGPLLQKAHLDGRLHVAGEHACYAFVGYMEGALHSGAQVARRIASDVAMKV